VTRRKGTDVFSKKKRSEIMRAVKGRGTKPELKIRKALHARGFRYRLNDRRLPGSPDLVFPKHRAVLFVHGCFWHGHDCARGARAAIECALLAGKNCAQCRARRQGACCAAANGVACKNFMGM
jgi:DNA mismatch endonuclease (patch repair protein)